MYGLPYGETAPRANAPYGKLVQSLVYGDSESSIRRINLDARFQLLGSDQRPNFATISSTCRLRVIQQRAKRLGPSFDKDSAFGMKVRGECGR
jgi:hypothetical protein